jgi:aspartate racemase
MHTPSLSAYVDLLERNDWDGIGALMAESAHKLETVGADFLICADNTIHSAFPQAVARSGLPWLPIAEVVASVAAQRNFCRVGIIGTRWLVESSVYPNAFKAVGIETRRPGVEERDRTGSIIMNELVRGIVSAASVSYLRSVVDSLRDQGCDAVVLGCTELPLAIDDVASSLPTLDSTRILATAAVHHAIGRA